MRSGIEKILLFFFKSQVSNRLLNAIWYQERERKGNKTMTNHKDGTWTISDTELSALMDGAEDAYNLSKTFTHQYDKEQRLQELLQEFYALRSDWE